MGSIEYLEKYNTLMNSEGWKDMNEVLCPGTPQEKMSDLWERLCEEGERLQQTYAWAIPNERALRIISEFGPIVEIGAGSGYWCKLLQDRGVDVLAYDIIAGKPELAPDSGKSKKRKTESIKKVSQLPYTFWTEVSKGGPDVLKKKGMKKRTLMLCYPDDYENSSSSMALKALQAYGGDTIIHVGELFGDSIRVTGAGCWGRTTGQDFQQMLVTKFHCILKAELPRWPISGDCISVWQRHDTTCIRYGDSENDSTSTDQGSKKSKTPKVDSFEDEETESDDNEDIFSYILKNDRISQDSSISRLEHLL